MSKWADFVITSVRYDKNHSSIIKVRRRHDNGSRIGNEEERSPSEVISDIEKQNYTYVTAYKPQEGKSKDKWKKGEKVYFVKIDGKKYLQTDPHKITKGSFSSLPEF